MNNFLNKGDKSVIIRLYYNPIGLNHRAHFYIAENFQQWAARRQLERMGALFFHIKFWLIAF